MSGACPVLGFVVRANPADRAVVGELLRFLESNELTTAERDADAKELHVYREGSQATNADRESVVSWAAANGAAGRITVSDLADLSSVV